MSCLFTAVVPRIQLFHLCFVLTESVSKAAYSWRN